MKTCIIDLEYGNINSISKMLSKLGYDSEISNNHNIIENSDRLILPGVGSFDTAINRLNKLNLTSLLDNEVLIKKKPILGICLGMQLMFNSSEEGKLNGLGWIDGEVVKFKKTNLNLKYPNIGWRDVSTNNKKLNKISRFYFVHNYYCVPKNAKDSLFNSKYGIDFCAGILKNNIMAVQFHPEKSHKYGLNFFKYFLNK